MSSISRRFWGCIAAGLLIGIGLPLTARAQDDASASGEAKAEEESGSGSFLDWDHMLGDWGGARSELEEKGIEFEFLYGQYFLSNNRGGLETKNGHDFGGHAIAAFELDFEAMGLIPGASFFMETGATYGGDDSDFDAEKIGGLSAAMGDAGEEDPFVVVKWWWRQRFLDDRLELRLGLLETGEDLFDVNEIAGSGIEQFMNSSFIVNGLIPHAGGLGLYVNVWPTDWLYTRAAVIDATREHNTTGFDTAFHDEAHFSVFYEVGLAPVIYTVQGDLPGHYRFGTWYNATTQEVFSPLADKQRSGDVGFYFGLDQRLMRENEDDDQGLSVFFRYAFGHQDVNLLDHFWSIGGQYVGLIPNRDADVLGIGVAQGMLSRQYRRWVDSTADRETVYEMYYNIEVTPWLIITPDVQVITNPGGSKDAHGSLITGVRMVFNF